MRVLVRLTGIMLTDDQPLEVTDLVSLFGGRPVVAPGSNIVACFEYLNADGSPKVDPVDPEDNEGRRRHRSRGRLNLDHDQALELIPHLFRAVYLEVTPATSPATSTSSTPTPASTSSTPSPATSTSSTPLPATSTSSTPAPADDDTERVLRARLAELGEADRPRNPGPVFAGSYSDDGGLAPVPDVPTIIADGKTYPAR